MTAGSFVGRVGGLAVALGIGAAISGGPMARAEADGSTSVESPGSDTSAATPTHPSSPANSTVSAESSASTTSAFAAPSDSGKNAGGTGRHSAVTATKDRAAAAMPTPRRSVQVVGRTAPPAGDPPSDGADDEPVEASRKLAEAGLDPARTAADKADHGGTVQTSSDDPAQRTSTSPVHHDPDVVMTSTHNLTLPAASPRGTPAVTPAAVATDVVATVAGTVLAPLSGQLPSAPVPSPTPLELLALARRETAQTATSSTAIRSAVDPLTASGAELADAHPNSSSTGAQQMTISESSLVQKLFVAGLQIVKAVGGVFGVDLFSVTAPLLTSQSPPWYTTFGLDAQRSEFDGWQVWTLSSPNSTLDDQVLVLHGGGYILEPTVVGWLNYASIARDTGAKVVVPIYPLAPQATAATVVPQTADLMSQLIAMHGSDKVSVYADSAGAGLALAATQELVRRHTATPGRMVLVSPWLDVTLSDPASEAINDPILTVSGLRGAGLQWAGDLDPTNPLVSPLFGSLDGLPSITIYSGSQDLLSPDTLRLQQRAVAEGIDLDVVFLNGGLHGWPGFFFFPEAIAALPAIGRALVSTR